MKENKDPMGTAIADYWEHGVAGRLRVFSPDFDEDEIPVETLFRAWDEMPPLEQEALNRAEGRILDVGAGAGCHSIVLQDRGKDVAAVELSARSADVIRKQGVEKVVQQDFFTLTGQWDTILMLMNGTGIVGTLERLPLLFDHLDQILAPGGQVLLDSSDLCYIYEDEDGIIELPEGEGYYGELQYQMQYKNIKGEPFPWLYLDADTLREEAEKHGYGVDIIMTGEHYDYLAQIKKVEK